MGTLNLGEMQVTRGARDACRAGELRGEARGVVGLCDGYDDSRRVEDNRDFLGLSFFSFIQFCEILLPVPPSYSGHTTRRARPGFGFGRCQPPEGVTMDLLAAEIARKRKAKDSLSTNGGVGKYAKNGDKAAAARRAVEESTTGNDGSTGVVVTDGTGDTHVRSKQFGDSKQDGTDTTTSHHNALSSEDDKTKDEPTDDVSSLDKTETIRRLRLLKAPVTLFGESDLCRRNRLREVQSTFVVRDEHATGGQQANERKQVLDELAKEEKARQEKTTLDGLRNKNMTNDDAVVGPSSGQEDAGPSETPEEDLSDVFASAARRAKKVAEASAKHPCDQIVHYFKSVLEEWQTEITQLRENSETWHRTEHGKQSTANCRLCATHLKPLFKRCKKRNLPEDLQRALFLIVKRMRDRDYRSAADAYVGVAIGNAAWPIGVTMVGIHERSARTKINAQTQAHAMHDEETRKYLQSVKRLMTFAQRRWPSTPSMSLDFNSGHNGWDKESLLAVEAVGGGDIRDVVPALALPDPNDPNATSAKTSPWKMLETSGFTRRGASDGWSSKASDVRTWRSVLKTAYDGEEGEGEK